MATTKTITKKGSTQTLSISQTFNNTSMSKPTSYVGKSDTHYSSVSISLPEGAEITKCRCADGISVSSYVGTYSTSGYSCLLIPGTTTVYGSMNNTTFTNYVSTYGVSNITFRVGCYSSNNDWTGQAGNWNCKVYCVGKFYPWFEITYTVGDTYRKIRYCPNSSKGWELVETYAPVDTDEGLKWKICQVYYVVNGAWTLCGEEVDTRYLDNLRNLEEYGDMSEEGV